MREKGDGSTDLFMALLESAQSNNYAQRSNSHLDLVQLNSTSTFHIHAHVSDCTKYNYTLIARSVYGFLQSDSQQSFWVHDLIP